MSEKSADAQSRRFVFLDPAGKRWPRLRTLLLAFGVVVFVAVVWFIEALFVKPELRLPAKVRQLKGQLKAALQQNLQPVNTAKTVSWQKFYNAPAAQERLAKIREQLRTRPVKKFSEI